ncbi:MAG: aryl-sulfate sulfotransferase [Bdellovibrionales bacterium]|nr:aryl-sulfate sulfotransferase [Bdellovibrionales bacterium]
MKKILPVLQIFALLVVAVAAVHFLEGKKFQSVRPGEESIPRARLDIEKLRTVDSYRAEIEARSKKRELRPYHTLRVFDSEKSFPGYTLFGVNENEEVLLLDHKGTLINSWPIDSDRSILMPETCSLVATHGTVAGAKISPWKELRFSLREYSYNGELLWEYTGPDILHHDVRYRSDRNTFLTLRRRNTAYAGERKFKENFLMKADGILEIDRNGAEVFSWNSEDHISHDFCGMRGCPTVEEAEVSRAEFKRQKDWTHMNTVSSLPENIWFEKGDQRFRPGNYLVHIRNFWMSYIIDSETKKVVWRFPERNEFDADSDIQIRGGHESHMIPPGNPGAGNILIFDNGNTEVRPYTRILEINPVTRKLVWSYQEPGRFFSRTAGATQRLPNGNTLISEDLKGRIFEVTKEGEIVWEVETPYRTARSRRYPLDWCSLS